MRKSRYVKPKQLAGYPINEKLIPEIVKKKNFHFRSRNAIGGEAPKDFLRSYVYGRAHKRNSHKWPSYIAKVGHKNYPVESIMEHFLTRVGQSFNFRVANSKLMRLDGQVRFLSEYFRKKDQRLIHGVEIIAAYLEDRPLIDEVEEARLSPELITFQLICESIDGVFGEFSNSIKDDFVRMLAFDAIIGHNDRHHFNWGVLTDLKKNKDPKFSPIYDTARALFWNDTEAKLIKHTCSNSQKNKFQKEPSINKNMLKYHIENYVRKSKPWTGWSSISRVNHFELIAHICDENPQYKSVLLEYCNQGVLKEVEYILNNEFNRLLSPLRRILVLECLTLRFERYNYIVKGGHHEFLK